MLFCTEKRAGCNGQAPQALLSSLYESFSGSLSQDKINEICSTCKRFARVREMINLIEVGLTEGPL